MVLSASWTAVAVSQPCRIPSFPTYFHKARAYSFSSSSLFIIRSHLFFKPLDKFILTSRQHFTRTLSAETLPAALSISGRSDEEIPPGSELRPDVLELLPGRLVVPSAELGQPVPRDVGQWASLESSLLQAHFQFLFYFNFFLICLYFSITFDLQHYIGFRRTA